MFAARPTAKRRTATTEPGTLFAESTLAVLTLSHTAEVDDGRAGGPVGAGNPGHRGWIDGASLAVCWEPQSSDVATALENVLQRRCKQSRHMKAFIGFGFHQILLYTLCFYYLRQRSLGQSLTKGIRGSVTANLSADYKLSPHRMWLSMPWEPCSKSMWSSEALFNRLQTTKLKWAPHFRQDTRQFTGLRRPTYCLTGACLATGLG